MESYFGVQYKEDPEERAVQLAQIIALGDTYPEYYLVLEELERLIRNHEFSKNTYREIIEAQHSKINTWLAVNGPRAAVEAFLEYENLPQYIVSGLINNRNLDRKEALLRYVDLNTVTGKACMLKLKRLLNENTQGVSGTDT